MACLRAVASAAFKKLDVERSSLSIAKVSAARSEAAANGSIPYPKLVMFGPLRAVVHSSITAMTLEMIPSNIAASAVTSEVI